MVVSDTKIIKFKELKSFIKKSINKVISNYLSLSGGTMKGDIVFNNGLGIKIKDDVGTQNDVLNANNTNELNVGNTLLNMKLISDDMPTVEVGGSDLGAIAYAKQLNEKLSLKGGTMEGVFNVDTLYFKVNTASGYRQAFGTIRGGLLALGSDELPAALYGYDKNQKPQWVYKEGSNYVFKNLALKDDIPQIKEVTTQFTPTVAEASGANEAEVDIDVSNWGVSNWRKVRIMYIHCAILNSDGGTNYSQNGYRNVNSFMINNGAITIKTYGCVPNQPNTIIVGYMELS